MHNDNVFHSCLPNTEITKHEYRTLRQMCLGRIVRASRKTDNVPKDLQAWEKEGFAGISISPRVIWESYKAEPDLFLITAILKENSSKLSVQAPLYPDWIVELMSNQNRIVAAESDEADCLADYVGKTNQDEQSFREAIAILSKLEPHYAHLVETLVRTIILVGGNGFWSSSVPRAHGAIFVNTQPRWTQAHYLETLVHESAHLELAIRQMLDPIVTNPQQPVYSSLRHRPRPLIGVFHAMFVLIRTCSVLSLYRDSSYCDDRDSTHALVDEFKGHLADTKTQLDEALQLTDKGEILYTHMAQVAREILA